MIRVRGVFLETNTARETKIPQKECNNEPCNEKPCFEINDKQKFDLINVNGLKINYRKGSADEFVIKEIFETPLYDLNNYKIERFPVIIDVGAQIGLFSLKMAQACPKSQIYAIEPEKENFELLKKNIADNGFTNIIPLNKAIASKNEKVNLYLGSLVDGKKDTCSHTIHKAGFSSNQVQQVDGITFKSFLEENKIEKIDLLKVDAEQAEYELFESFPEEILNKTKSLILELHKFPTTKQDPEDLMVHLKKKGFSVIINQKAQFLQGTQLLVSLERKAIGTNLESNNGPYIVFSISGGIGKNIMATAVITSIKAQYPNHKLIIVTAYPEVYLDNSKVHRVFKFGNTPYFMDDYVKDDTLIFQIDPYQHNSFVHKKKHLIDCWCETFGIKSITRQPEIYLTKREIEFAKRKFARDKPLFVIQTNGGGENQKIKYSWARDIPINQAQVVVDVMKETHHVMHIRRQDQLALNNAEVVSDSLREKFALILISDKRLFIDSFPQHCAAAFRLSSTVCWIGTQPSVYSYEFHTNVLPKDEKQFIHTIDKYMEDAPWQGEKMFECPYDTEKLFSVTQIVESIKKQPTNPNTPLLLPNQMAPQQNQLPLGNTIDNYFNAIYVINLDSRTDRWAEVQKQLAQGGITKYQRMPGVSITEKELESVPKENYSNFRGINAIIDKEKFEKKYILGALGARRAHLNCILDAKKNNFGKILILEDDIIINKNANQMFANILSQVGDQWGMLYLGGDYWKNNKTFQASSYALDAKLFDPIIENLIKSGEELDFFYVNQIQPKFKVLRATPMIMVQSKTDSDIPTMEIKK